MLEYFQTKKSMKPICKFHVLVILINFYSCCVWGGDLKIMGLTHKSSIASGLNSLVGYGVDRGGVVRYVIVWPNGEKPVIERMPVKQGEGIELRFKGLKLEGPTECCPVVLFTKNAVRRGPMVQNLDEKRLREILRNSKDDNKLLTGLAANSPVVAPTDKPVDGVGEDGKK